MTVHKELILNGEIEREYMFVCWWNPMEHNIYNIIDECFLPAGLFYGSVFWFSPWQTQ